jgi:UPF0176 protein
MTSSKNPCCEGKINHLLFLPMDEKKYLVLAYYLFTRVEDPKHEVREHKKFFESRDVTARIYISHEGINGQMSASLEAAEQYMEWLKSRECFARVEFKIHYYHSHAFPRVSVKVRKQLVAIDCPVDISLTAEHVEAKRWEQMVAERDDDTVILDVRNAYEWEIGHFEGAELPTLEQFREFPTYAKKLKEQRDLKKTKVMMYCTGGIRCELFSALLKQEGFENVFQLDGGVIKYGLENGSKEWRGKLFVFDDRMAVPLDEKEEVISKCRHCDALSDVHYNCASMDCNELFTCCPACAEAYSGCCCQTCSQSPRLRPLDKEARPKPFRRKHLIKKK